MNTIIVVSGVIICLGSLALYLIVSFLAPEWLGISGKRSQENLKEKGNDVSNSRPKDFFSS